MSKNEWHEVEFLVHKERWENLRVGNSFIGRVNEGNLFVAKLNECQLGAPAGQVLVTISGRINPDVMAALVDFVQVWCAEDED